MHHKENEPCWLSFMLGRTTTLFTTELVQSGQYFYWQRCTFKFQGELIHASAEGTVPNGVFQ